ncbi:hypothetical protein BpHYR1_031894 [Brachionus plicatilis]|uniref:Uncharacterized protein n=1 Tax=Brachionus plicatilis TaxID=10195 RepID=A0A3M7SUR8_BRAPC|nr:hypothetical protein BpHYR1_031894 [Brachionus plicatilis]
MKKTFNTIRFLLGTKNLEVRKPFFRIFCSTSFRRDIFSFEVSYRKLGFLYCRRKKNLLHF